MLSKVTSFALSGLEGVPVEVETDVQSGLPGYELVGLPDAAVKESRERVRSALKNSGKAFPTRKVTVNLAPADLRKEGTYFDLAIAVGILAATGQLEPSFAAGYVFLGELALDGALRPVAGILPLLISAKAGGYRKFVIPAGNAGEASYIEGIETYAASSLAQAVDHLSGFAPLAALPVSRYGAAAAARQEKFDLAFVKGQAVAKRALEVAVSGNHNLLLVGPPGAGKTMLARCIPGIMPAMTFEEALEVTKIHSVAGILGEEGIVTARPFRSPHHTATAVAICGGGSRTVKPGRDQPGARRRPVFGRAARVPPRRARSAAPAPRGRRHHRHPQRRHLHLSRQLHALRQHEPLPLRQLWQRGPSLHLQPVRHPQVACPRQRAAARPHRYPGRSGLGQV